MYPFGLCFINKKIDVILIEKAPIIINGIKVEELV